MAGLFFCLASAEGAGLLFLPCYNTAKYKRLQHSLYHPCNYTARTPKPFTGLYRAVSVDLPYSSAHNTVATQAEYTPPATRWRAYRQTQHVHRYQIPQTRRTLYRSAQPPIIIRYIRVQRCAPCYGSMPARRGQLLPCANRWQVLYPAHLLRGQCLHLYRVSPAGSRCFPRLALCFLPGTGGAGPLTATAAALFGLSPDNQ